MPACLWVLAKQQKLTFQRNALHFYQARDGKQKMMEGNYLFVAARWRTNGRCMRSTRSASSGAR